METLPEELVHMVLGLLDERTLRRSVPAVCRLWARLARTRGVWRNVTLTFEREADFAERCGWTPPEVLALELRRCGAPGALTEEQWRTVLRCAAHPRRLAGLSWPHRAPPRGQAPPRGPGLGPVRPRRLLELLDKCWHSVEHLSLRLEPPLDEGTARLWTLLASMPRLTRLELSMADSKSPWLADPDCLPHELCWHWDEGWPCLRRLDLRGLPAAPCEWLLAGFLRVRGPQLRELILSPGLQLTPRLVRALRRCTRLQHFGAGCGHNLWRLDAFDNLTGLTLLGLPRRSTTTWMLRSPLAARLDSLGLDGVNPSLFDVLPAVGTACHNLRTISFRRCQVPARFALPLVGCPLLQEVRADNMRAEHVMEARRLPHLERLRLSGHLGNYASMMVAVAGLRAAKPDLQVEGLEDGLFNNWGPGVQRALALSRPAVAS